MAGLCIHRMLQFVQFLLISVFNHTKRGGMFFVNCFFSLIFKYIRCTNL